MHAEPLDSAIVPLDSAIEPQHNHFKDLDKYQISYCVNFQSNNAMSIKWLFIRLYTWKRPIGPLYDFISRNLFDGTLYD